MSEYEILDELTDIFRRVFLDDSIELMPETTAADIADWDSIANITLIVEVEHHFRMKFKIAEVEELRNIGSLVHLIKSRMPAVVV